MENCLVKIDAKEYGLQESKAKEIEAMFTPMIEKMKELETEYNSIVTVPITQEVCNQAKELRLKYVKVRTGTAQIHKEAKAYFLAGGKFVDGWKNAQLYASQGMENELSRIETHYENIEKERKKQLQQDRMIEYKKYSNYNEGTPEPMLSDMPIEIWEGFIEGAKRLSAEKKEAERKAVEEKQRREKEEREAREAKEKAEKEEQERIRIENEKLRQEKLRLEAEAKKKAEEERIREEQRQYEMKIAREEQEKKEQARITAEKKEKERIEKEHQAKLEKEKEARKREEEKHKAKLEEERKEKQKLKDELDKAKKEQEQREEAEREKVEKEIKDKEELLKESDENKLKLIDRIILKAITEIENIKLLEEQSNKTKNTILGYLKVARRRQA